jgi:ferritin-like metal-binding protein YciE
MIKPTRNNGGRRQSAHTTGQRREPPVTMDNPLHEAFLDEVADIYNAEQQLIKALPRMAKAARSEELRQAFESHLHQTEEQAHELKTPWKQSASRSNAKSARAWKVCWPKEKR